MLKIYFKQFHAIGAKQIVKFTIAIAIAHKWLHQHGDQFDFHRIDLKLCKSGYAIFKQNPKKRTCNKKKKKLTAKIENYLHKLDVSTYGIHIWLNSFFL